MAGRGTLTGAPEESGTSDKDPRPSTKTAGSQRSPSGGRRHVEGVATFTGPAGTTDAAMSAETEDCAEGQVVEPLGAKGRVVVTGQEHMGIRTKISAPPYESRGCLRKNYLLTPHRI
jgi:hypothetical protein